MKRGLTAPIRSSYADAADFLRALCIFFIAWFHIWQQSWLNPNFTLLGHPVDIYPGVACGYMFVDLMLALSGFLLMLGFLNGRDRAPRRFYVARAARILPSYWFCLIVVLFCFFSSFGFYSYARELTISLESRGKGLLTSISQASYDIYLIHCLSILVMNWLLPKMEIDNILQRFDFTAIVTYFLSFVFCVLQATIYANIRSKYLRASATRARKMARRKRYL